MIPDPLDRNQALLDRIEAQEDETIPYKHELANYPYAPFCPRVFDATGLVAHQLYYQCLPNNTLRKWIDLAYRCVTEEVGVHPDIRKSANQLIDDFGRELAKRLDTLDEELPF